MTDVLVTVDTELSAALHQRGVTPCRNVENSIGGVVRSGAFGIGWQMDRLEEHGLKGVFFVDPMPALVYGEGVVADIVGPILARGHEVQLHAHTEWLAWAAPSPVGARRGQNIADFELTDQIVLLQGARDALERAGVPRPIAFRAGNFGADDRTLVALSKLGIVWDSSFNPAYLGGPCRIGLNADTHSPVRRHGVIELPVSGLCDRRGAVRPAQVCALSRWEMIDALRHASDAGEPAFVIVSHSFEMLSRDRCRPNRAVMARFVAMCREIADNPNLRSAGFADLDPAIASVARPDTARLAPNPVRTFGRVLEQAAATLRYERPWLPVR
ncbi:hypothetical protein AB5I39_00130 [Sphingomonas sp. MMS24-J45]|uniref:polysaccharide deacetylase family protein n=1 Tax=Sphingomonas sp. MMS24-J45 TaxID=3238806 RepID=UPI003850D4C8